MKCGKAGARSHRLYRTRVVEVVTSNASNDAQEARRGTLR